LNGLIIASIFFIIVVGLGEARWGFSGQLRENPALHERTCP
jgi:hypothetical protein